MRRWSFVVGHHGTRWRGIDYVLSRQQPRVAVARDSTLSTNELSSQGAYIKEIGIEMTLVTHAEPNVNSVAFA